MANPSDPTSPFPDAPEVAVKTRRGFSIVWIIPLVAVAIAGWLAYTTLTEKGPTITIAFKTAAGLEAGKTKVKYKDVDVGVVKTVGISKDLSHIVVTAEMSKGIAEHLTEGTRFWVVLPRLSAAGVSGLGTLVSGAYIQMDPTEGKEARKFTGLEVPPVVTSDVPGTDYVLRAGRLGSLNPGSPLYYRGISVGEVLGYDFGDNERSILIHVFVRTPHDRLIRKDTRFWNASGVDVSIGADGVEVKTESVQALLSGGVAFETPSVGIEEPQSPSGTVFPLYESRASIAEAQYVLKVPYLLHFEGSVRGLQAGAPVEFRGIKIGSVTDVRLEFDVPEGRVRIPVTIEVQPQRINIVGQYKDIPPYVQMEQLIGRGLRAQLKPASLLTGQLLVALDFYPDSPPAKLGRDGQYPEIPTVPTELEEITRSGTALLDKISRLPINELVTDMRNAVQAYQRLAESPEITQSLKALRQATEDAQKALTKAESTMTSADQLIGPNSQLRYDLTQLMKELKDAARSFRVLADYLERHPEALIQGKAGGQKQ